MPHSLGSDNHSGIHPRILQALLEANSSHAHSYGGDEFSRECEKLFKKIFGSDSSAFLVFNGTAANVACLKALTRSYEAVICSEQSHLHLDECGAPEYHLGIKLLTLPSEDGKIRPEQIGRLLVRLGDQHHVQPRVVSITQPTELGVCYTMEELAELRKFTRQHNLKLHMDGARLANAAVFLGVSLTELTSGVGLDALSFGGTKNGLLGGEVVVLWNQEEAKHFKFYRKQLLQLPSKMRFMSAQFLAYLNDDLYKEIAEHSHRMAKLLESGLRQISDIDIVHPVESNAVFAKIPKSWSKILKDEMFFYVWDEHQWLCRLMTSFDSTPTEIHRFIDKALALKENSHG